MDYVKGFTLKTSYIKLYENCSGYPEAFYPTVIVTITGNKVTFLTPIHLTLLNESDNVNEIKITFRYPCPKHVINLRISNHITTTQQKKEKDKTLINMLDSITPTDLSKIIVSFLDIEEIPWDLSLDIKRYEYFTHIPPVHIGYTLKKYDDSDKKQSENEYVSMPYNVMSVHFGFFKGNALQKENEVDKWKSYFNNETTFKNGIYKLLIKHSLFQGLFSMFMGRFRIPYKEGFRTFFLITHTDGYYSSHYIESPKSSDNEEEV